MEPLLAAGARPLQKVLEGAGALFVAHILVPLRNRFPAITPLTRANTITALRMTIIGPIVYGVIEHRAWSFWLFVAAALSDLVDGWIARHDGPTRMGTFLDSTSDKLLSIPLLGVLLIGGYIPQWTVNLCASVLIVLEILGLYANIANFLDDGGRNRKSTAASADARTAGTFGTIPGKIKFWAICLGISAMLAARLVWPEWLAGLRYFGYFALCAAVPLAMLALRRKFLT